MVFCNDIWGNNIESAYILQKSYFHKNSNPV